MLRCSLALFLIASLPMGAGCGSDRDRGPGTDFDAGPMTGSDGSVPGADGSTPGTDGSTPGIDGGTPPTSDLVDPSCVDGMYTETLADPTADISDLVSGYDSAEYQSFVHGVLQRRYPVGADLVRGGQMNTSLGDCVERFLSTRGTSDDVIRRLSTVVHECGHFYDMHLGGFSNDVYVLTEETRFSCAMGDTTSRGGLTFARSRLNGDEYSSLRPPCDGGSGGCDFYADVYLDGDPDDGTFDGGDQGFNSVLEETVQYVNSLATGYAFHGDRSGSVSERDGILTFLWYLGRYLRMARLDYPGAYDHISTTACWRDAILTVWGRAWLYLEVTEGIAGLGIDDDALYALATHPDMLAEIDRLRALAGCG